MTEEERLRYALDLREQLEYELRQAKLLEELRAKHLARADQLIAELTGKLTEKVPRIQRRYARMTREEVAAAIAAFQSGTSASQIARTFNRSVATIVTKLKQAGVVEAQPRGLTRKKNPDGAHARQDRVLRLAN